MVLKRKIELEKVIKKGGNVAADKREKKQWANFTLRISFDMLDDIDEAMESTVGISKTGWILQAIQDKLRKENQE